ncbi:MAG: hypothetical protein WCP52_06230 [Bacteroidota bacterium]
MKKTITILGMAMLTCASSMMLNGCKKEETATPPAKKQCEISNTGTIEIVNQTPYTIYVKIDGSTPSGMGAIAPGANASTDVTAGVLHTFFAETVAGSSQSHTWTGSTVSVGACLLSGYNITL